MSRTILIIESEPWLADHYRQTLEKSGFTVVTATNAYTAIDGIDTKLPAVIVLGMLLSGASALNLLHELQSYPDTATVPVIACSNLPQLQLDDLRPYGVLRLLDTTTMQPADLVAAVRSVLG